MNTYLRFDGFELWHVAGWTMVHFLWLGTLVGLAAAAIRPLFPRVATNGRYALAVLTLAMLAALPFGIATWLIATSPPSFTPEPPSAAQIVPAAPNVEPAATGRLNDEIIELSGLEPVAVPTGKAPSAPGPAGGFPRDGMQETVAHGESVPENLLRSRGLAGVADGVALWSFLIQSLNACVPSLPLVWFVGTPISFALLATGVVGTRRLRRASRGIERGPITEQLVRLAASMRVGRRVGIAVCERIAAPVLVGILRPIILLPPAALTGWSPDEIEMVLLHELAHVRRWDNAVNLAQRVIESLLFFHPAVWLVSNWIRREREACCDAIVVGRTNRPHAYAELLVALAAQMPRSVLFHPAASSAMAAGPLRKRIRRILQLEDDPMLVSGNSFVMVLASLLVAATLTVLYLPSIGQAEESAGQRADSAIDSKESTTEDTEDTEKNSENQKSEGESDTFELSANQLQFDTPNEKLVIEADDEPDRVRLRSSQGIANESGGGHGENIFVAYNVPQHLMPSLEKWAELMAVKQYVSDKSGRFVMQAPDEIHKRLQELLNATKLWQNSSATRAREQNPIVTSVVEGQLRLELRTLGLIVGSEREVERKSVGKYATEPTRIAGLEIIDVKAGSPGAWLTMEPNDTLTQISNFEIQSPAALKSIVETFLDVASPAQRTITFVKADGEQRTGRLPTVQPNRESADELGSDREKTAPDDWLRGIAFASPKDGEIARRAWKELGIKVVPASEAELEIVRRGGFRGGLKVLGLEDAMNIEGPLVMTLIQSKRLAMGIGDFAGLERALDAFALQPAEELIVLQGIKTGGGVFQYSMRRPQAAGPVQSETRSPFPSLEEQKLADVAFRKLGWELEAIDDEDLARVKALGYEGGVKVAYAPQPAGFTNISYGHIQTGDLLVGLHVWPTTSLKQVIDVLARDDLAELNPIKFYVVRPLVPAQSDGVFGDGGGRGGGLGGTLAQSIGERKSKDIIMTGRITVPVDKDASPSQSRHTTPTMRTPWDLGPSTVPPTSAQSDAPLTPGGLKVYFFHSDDSAPSRNMRWLVKRITEVPPGAQFTQFDVDKNPELAKRMNIDRVPTSVFMREGTELGRLIGEQTEEQVRDAIRTILKSNDLPDRPAVTAAPRLFDPNHRTETSANRVVKTFDAKTPAEDVKAAIETLAEAGAIGGPAQVEVVPQNGKTALVVRGPAASTRDVAPNRANLRYEGKTFDEWRDAWRTELSTEKRLEAVKALAAFGSAGSNVIKQSDVLKVNAVRIVPKSPHPIEPFDGLLIRVTDAPASDPIADAFVVDPEGKVDLGQRYGMVSVRGMTTAEAQDAVHQHLVKRITGEDPLSDSNPMFVTVSLAFSAGSQQVVGEHLVGPDGKINLGTYGSVPVAGKTIDEARRAIESQLANYLENPEVVVHMFATDSGRNYAQEAAAAIITVAGQYNWSKPASNESLILLREACLGAFGGNNNRLPAQLPPSEALSALLQAASSSAAPIREFAAIALQHYARQDQAALDAIVQLSRDEDAYVRKLAWSTLFHTYTPDSPAAFARVREALASDQPELHTGALKAISKYDQRRKLQQATSAAERHMPEIAVLLFSDEPEVRRHARQAVYGVAPEAASRIVQQLMEVLQTDSRSADHVHAIRALAALGPRAKPAVDLLTEILVANQNSLRIPAAAALTSILGEREFNKLLGETIAADLKVDVDERGVVSMRGQPDSQIFLDFSNALKAERRALFP